MAASCCSVMPDLRLVFVPLARNRLTARHAAPAWPWLSMAPHESPRLAWCWRGPLETYWLIVLALWMFGS